MNNLLLKKGTIVNSEGHAQEDLLIEDGRISAIKPEIITDTNVELIECKDKLIFPGLIDSHTHMGIPIKDGYSADNFESGSRSALNGGITAVIDFTILGKDQSLEESLIERKKQADTSVIHVSFHCNITRFDKEILAEIPKIIKMGYNSFKVFTTYKEADMMLSYNQIEEIAKVIHDYDGLLMVHAEDNEIIDIATKPLIAKELTHPKYHAIARPPEAEVVAIENMANISEVTGCKTYIVHLNTAAGLSIAKDCANMFIETCPQYLLLDDSVYKREDGAMYVASPPLRSQNDCEALWKGIEDGSIDVLATDHCPFMLDDKPRGIHFQNIPNGIGGVETLFPVMLNQFIERGISLSRMVQLMCKNPAEIFNLDDNYGDLSIGKKANLLIVNPNIINMDWNYLSVSKIDWNAFSEFPAIFPEKVIVS
jgi:dihydropyrimidinase